MITKLVCCFLLIYEEFYIEDQEFGRYSVKTGFGILLGIFAFFTFAYLVGLVFQKSPEQIAVEKCEELRAQTKYLLPDGVPITVSVEGQQFQCN